jgi:hypothetical protein
MVGDSKRLYRVIALGVVLILAGGYLFFFGKEKKSEETAEVKKVVSSRTILDPVLRNMPSPDTYRRIAYADGKISGATGVVLEDGCHATYATLLVYPASVDYREDVSRAVVNRALPCESGKAFQYGFSAESLKNFGDGEYYYFFADQGEEGTWYNPR